VTLKTAWRGLRGRAPLLNAWLTIPDAFSYELMARQRYDCFTIDMQHGLIDYDDALQMLRVSSSSAKPALVRIPSLDAGLIAKVLDGGACGLICPKIESQGDAERLVAATRYPPLGQRSHGPSRAALCLGDDYFDKANSIVLLLAMIETAKGVANLPDILAVEGLDGIYIGPSDLSISMGYRPGVDPKEPAVYSAIERVRGLTKAKGLLVAISSSTPQAARDLAARGFDLLSIGTDAQLLMSAAQNTLNEFLENASVV
jgi:4-hydroxy-2-oxoheptanedioate aldolase